MYRHLMDMCADMCTDMCKEGWASTSVYRHVYRHVQRGLGLGVCGRCGVWLRCILVCRGGRHINDESQVAVAAKRVEIAYSEFQ